MSVCSVCLWVFVVNQICQAERWVGCLSTCADTHPSPDRNVITRLQPINVDFIFLSPEQVSWSVEQEHWTTTFGHYWQLSSVGEKGVGPRASLGSDRMVLTLCFWVSRLIFNSRVLRIQMGVWLYKCVFPRIFFRKGGRPTLCLPYIFSGSHVTGPASVWTLFYDFNWTFVTSNISMLTIKTKLASITQLAQYIQGSECTVCVSMAFSVWRKWMIVLMKWRKAFRLDQCWGVTEYMYRRYVFRIQIMSNCIPLQLQFK